VSVVFTPGCRYGIIGANGTGKSTFLKIINGEQSADKGTIFIDPKAKLGWLRQDHYRFDNETVLNTVYQGDAKLWKIMKQEGRPLHQGRPHRRGGQPPRRARRRIHGNRRLFAESRLRNSSWALVSPAQYHNELMKEIPTQYKFRVLLAQILSRSPR
jgi:ATPase subunit of ABC transporter with duplicated ATPase domains